MKNLAEVHIQFVKGIGPKRAEAFVKAGIATVKDLLHYFPYRHLDRRNVTSIRDVHLNEENTVVGEIIQKSHQRGRKSRLQLVVYDETGFLTVIFFHQIPVFDKLFQVGDQVAFSGKVTYYHGFQMVHPDFEFFRHGKDIHLHTGSIIPLYSITEPLRKNGISSYSLRRIIRNALEQFGPFIEETLPDYIMHYLGIPSMRNAIQWIHFPEDEEKLEQARKRIKLEELLYFLMVLEIQRVLYSSPRTGISFSHIDDVVKKVIQDLPFELTSAQRRVLREIYQDMQKDTPMHRLLQGDVGSGKTVVALIAMLIARANGYQSVLMVPTEILADQHYFNFKNLLFPFGIEPILLKGSQKPHQRNQMLEKIKNDPRAIIIGTHALIQENVDFSRLGLVVIDEQHRFGVMQRAQLVQKGKVPDLLVMTATPIPRTLALMLYGDLDQSRIDEMPPGRKPVKTVWRKWDAYPRIIDYIYDLAMQGKQSYLVLPLIEESEKLDVKAAVEMFEELQQTKLKEAGLGLLHGKMKAAEKEEVMTRFKEGAIKILVSTTVIEVGVDVPNATFMLIVHAERFGLSQLHQLRGRVGRGSEQAYCVLLTEEEISEDARKRMEVMCKTHDGFEIAEYDLQLRGMGDILGTRQHGMPAFQYFDPIQDERYIGQVKQLVHEIIKKDPHLRGPQHGILRQKILQVYSDSLQFLKGY